MTQLTLDLAQQHGQFAAQACTAKADRTDPGWSDRALQALQRFARNQHAVFTIEMARSVIAAEVSQPHDLRAWGSITSKAVAAGFIQRVPGRTAPAASSNGSPKPLYRRGPKA
jgi:hypothetical protein